LLHNRHKRRDSATGEAMKAINWAIPRIRNSAALPWAMLAVGVLFSLLLWRLLRDNIESAAEERFEHQVTEAKQIIERRILSYVEVLFGARALFAAHNQVTRLQFHDFVHSLDLKTRFPGFDSINYTAYVRADDKERFVDSVRHDTSLDPNGYPRFTIKPPGARLGYYVLVYLEPMAGFEFAFGLDIGANPAMGTDRQAMAAVQQSGMDSGKLTASGLPIPIKTGTREYVGLGMRLPVYRNAMPLDTVEQRRTAYLGSVGAGFNVEELLTGVLEEKTTRYMRFRVYGPASDQPSIDPPATAQSISGTEGKERLLFDSDQLIHTSAVGASADDPSLMFARVAPMEIAGRTWEIHFSARKDAVIDRVDRLMPSIVLIAGLLSSLLLFGVLFSLSSSRNRAVALAARMTRDLRESEERFRLIAENASDLITVIDPQGRRVYANPAFGKLFGDVQALIGVDASAHIHPEDQGRVRKSFLETIRDGKAHPTEFRFLLPGGEVRDIESSPSAVLDPQGKVEFVVAVARDVTERRRTEEALRARDVQLQEAQALANLGSWEWDLRTNSRTWSDQLSRIFGLRPKQLPSTFDGFYPLVHADDRERTANLAREALRTGKSYENQFRIVRPDGVVRTLHNQARVDRDETGKAVRVIGVCQDITERKLAEEQVRISQERFRMMVENVRDYAIYMLDIKGYVTSWNLGAERIGGYFADEIIGKHYSRFFLPDHAMRGDPGMQLQFASIQGRYESEGWRVRKNGSQFWAHVILTPLRDETGKLRGFSEIVHDITDRKRAEEDLHSYADRLKTTSRRLVEVQESERRLLATELHDRVGQNLTALGINLSIIAGGLPTGTKPELAARLEDCNALVGGTVDAMRDVMAELRPHALDDYGLPAALRSLATGFSRRTGIQVAFEKEGRGADLPKPVDLAMFRIAQEALNNVAKHAQAQRVEIAIRRKNGSAVLSVRDYGIGFDPQRIDGPRAEAGWGLLIMRERAEAVGAHFSLKAVPNSGVQVLVEYNA
jgi:PAS domain S-box-containing protein